MEHLPDRIKDERLLDRSARGDTAAFGDLVLRHGPALLRLARAYAADDASAEDIVQQALLDALRGAGTYRPGVSSVRTWMFAIARNVGRRSTRRAREVPTSAPPEPELIHLGLSAGWGAPDERLERAETATELARAIASLSSRDREVLLLRDVEGLSGEATAELMGIGLAATKSRLHRARLRLMSELRRSDATVTAQERSAGGLRCRDVLARLPSYLDGTAAIAERGAVEAHLRECEVCERFGGRYTALVHALRVELGAPPALDSATFERVIATLRDARHGAP